MRCRELDEPLPDHVRRHVDEAEIRCRIALRDLDGAARLLEAVEPARRSAELLARLDLVAGRPDRAADRLTQSAEPTTSPRSEIECLLLLARAYLQLGYKLRAQDALRRAMERGRADGYVRPFVDDADELIGLLQALADRRPDAYLANLLSRPDGADRSTTAAQVEVLEPLTDRERQLLGYLPSCYSQGEIASEMAISRNTVKTHTKALYRKLGAASRSEAVAVARSHGLL